MQRGTFERRLLLAALAAWAAIAALTLALGAPLGHDEAAFGVVGRGQADDWLYRSRGVVALYELGRALGGAEWQLRLPFALIGAGLVVAVFALGRAVFDAATGAWAAAVIAGAHWMVLRNTEALGDLPAATCVIAALALAVTELERDGGPRWRFVLVAPLAAAAFYVRYGSAPLLALGGLAAAALWWRAILRRPAPVVVAVVLFGALLVPHVLHSLDATGRVLGVLELSRGTPRRGEFFGEGLVTYLTSNPFRFYGALAAPVAAIGLLSIVRVRRRAPWFLWLVAVGQIVALGLQSHAQPRYVFVALALLIVLGVAAIRGWRPAARPVLRRRVALGLVAATWLGAAIAVVPLYRVLARARTPFVDAGAAVRADAAGRPCLIGAPQSPQLAWYSGCVPMGVFEPDYVDLAYWPLDHRHYLAIVPGAPLAPETIPAVAARLQATPVELPAGRARVWRLDR